MRIMLVRHGESTANVAGLLSSLPSDEVALTEYGRTQVRDASRHIRGKIDAVYISPLRRTLETADILFHDWKDRPVKKVDGRIREINYGNYSGRRNNSRLDAIREAQVAGDYQIRFGDSGENKFEILMRLYDFLIDVIGDYSSSARIVVVSHGSITGWLERIILALGETKAKHKHVVNAEVRTHTLRKRDIKKLIRHKLVDEYCAKTTDFSFVSKYRSEYVKLANLYNDGELEPYVFEQLLKGAFESDITLMQQHIDRESLGASEVIAVCALHNSAAIVGEYIEHYVGIGVKNFVFIDNNSDDESVEIIRSKTADGIRIDIWQTKDRFDGFKAMGWKQRAFHYYGLDRWYLNLDVDELAVFIGCEASNVNTLVQYATERGLRSVGGILVDMYRSGRIVSNKPLDENTISEFRFFDTGGYTCEHDDRFGARICGGPRTRLFRRHPSLQKFPLAFLDSETIAVNPHFWFPYEVNLRSERLIGLLHFKFLPGDLERYVEYVESAVHWDNSSQYRSYVEYMSMNRDASFYDEQYSSGYEDSKSLLKLVDENGKMIISRMPPSSHPQSIV